MSARTIFTLAGLTLLSIFLLTVLWEFVLEDIIGQLFSSDYEKESLQTHWEYVITGTSLAAIALIIPTLALLRSIAERKRAEELLKIAIDSMPEGFACYDADDRLAVVNSKMAKLYPLIADVFVPGVSFEKVLRLGVERGQFGPSDGRTEEWIQERLAYHRDPKGAVEYELSDVRTVRVEEMRTPEGGIVGVRTDITDLKKIERQLREVRDDLEIRVEERTRELMQSETWLKAVIKCSPGAIVIRNLEGRSLIANEVYSDWYAVDGDEIIGKTMVDGLPPDTFEGITAQEQEVVETKQIVQAERRMTFPDGVTRDIISQKSPIFGPDGDCVAIGTVITDITELKRAEEAIRESGERYRRTYNNTPVMLHSIDRDGRLLSASDHWLKVLGYERDEVIGQKIIKFMTEDAARTTAGTGLRRLKTAGRCTDLPLQFVKKNGEVVDVLLSAVAERDEAGEFVRSLTVLTDVTERKRAEDALRASEERFRTIAENVPGNVYRRILHPDGRVRWAYLSPGLRDLMELDPDEVIAQPELLTRTLHEDDRAKCDETVQKSVETLEPYVLEYRRITPSGKVKWMRTMARPHRRENGAVVWDGVTLDITEEKEAQAQLIHASKLATLGELASGIAHEINQPLSVMGMSAELSLMSLEEGAFDVEFVRKKLETIVGQRDRMAEIIDHMRLFSRTDNATLESFNPVDAVAGGIRLIEQQFRAAGIELETDCPADCRHVSGYPLQLEQVVLNLLTNARDAVIAMMDSAGSGNGSPAPKVRVSLVDDKRRKTVVISVADNGGGIPEPAIGRIFDPFFTTKTEGHGTGLGLSISYSIIDAMGGRLEAENTEGGAVFRISLSVPLNGAGAVNRGRGGKRKTRTRRPRARLPRVLVVDDEEAIVEEVAEYLGRKGYDVATAGNGREALDLHQARPADVVVTDLFMPEMSGAELIRRLHKSDPDLPIVVVTGHTTFGDDRDIVAEGASVVLKKPIVLRDLTESLKGLGRR